MTDFSIRAGESLVVDSTITNNDGTPRDITDARLTFKVYLAPSKPLVDEETSVVLTGTSDVVSGEDGAVTSYFTAEDTAGMDFRVLYFEIVLVEEDATTSVIESGKLTIGSI